MGSVRFGCSQAPRACWKPYRVTWLHFALASSRPMKATLGAPELVSTSAAASSAACPWE